MSAQTAEFAEHVPLPEVVGGFEVPPLSPEEERLLAAITFPAEMQETWRQQFNTGVQTVLDACVDPKDHEAIATVGAALEWLWFAGPTDPLPEGVMLSDRNYDTAFTSPEVHRIHNAVASYIVNSNDIHEIMDARQSYFYENMADDARAAFTALVKKTPAYEFLRALATDVPESRDVPLTLAQRMVREAQEEDEVRRTHGIDRDAHLRMYPEANHTLQRRLSQLDDETMRAPTQHEADPKQRLMNFILGRINARKDGYIWDEDFNPETDTIVRLARDGEHEIRGYSQTGAYIYLSDEMYDFSSDWVDEQNGEDRVLADFDESYRLLNQLAVALLDPEKANVSATEILEDITAPDLDYLLPFGSIPPKLRLYLERTQVPVVSCNRLGFDDWAPSQTEQNNVSVTDAEVIEESRQLIIGNAYGARWRNSMGRVIMGVRGKPEYTPYVDDFDLLLYVEKENEWLVFGNYRFQDTEPYIPGYRIVAHSDQNWYLKEAEVDPYLGTAEVVIQPAHQDALATEVQAIGLTQLAQELRDQPQLNLETLATLVQSHSDYTFDRKYDLRRNSNKFTSEDFARLVDEHGRLQVQCTGAAAFLRHILKTALPGSTTKTIGGNTINRRGEIADVGHAQIMVAHENEQYIVDATPPSHMLGGFGTDVMPDTGHGVRTERHVPANKKDVIADEESKHIEVVSSNLEVIQNEQTERVEHIVDRTKQLLKAHYNLPTATVDEKLYEKVMQLKKDADPIRRTLELVLRHDNGQDLTAELDHEVEYLENLTTANPQVWRRVGIPQYDKTFLVALQNIVKDIRTAQTTP